MAAVGNGRQAGGGIAITPDALLDDGLLDATFVRNFSLADARTLVDELSDPAAPGNVFVFAVRSPSLTIEAVEGVLDSLNLDGEPTSAAPSFHFETRPQALSFVLPAAADSLLTTADI